MPFVNPFSVIEASHYNQLQARAGAVLNLTPGGYGVTSLSTPVTVGTTITAEQWQNLYSDLNKILAHETNTIATTSTLITSGTIVYASFVNFLESSTVNLLANTTTVHPSQLASTTVDQVSSRLSEWSNVAPIVHKVVYSWDDYSHMSWFFNLGGKITPLLGSTGAVTSEDTTWAALISSWTSGILTANQGIYQRSDFQNPGITKTYTLSSSGRSISLTYTPLPLGSTPTSLEASLQLSTTNDVTLQPISTFTNYYSVNSVTPTGIAAPRPDTQTTIDFETGAALLPGVIPTRRLTSDQSSLTFNAVANRASSSQTISIQNNGNQSVIITDIRITNYGAEPTSNVSSITFPRTLAYASELPVTISYQGASTGTFNNSLTVFGNMDRGNYTVPITVNIVPDVFDFTLTPSSVTQTVNTLETLRQKLLINVTFGSYTTYSVSISDTTRFSVDSSQANGPVLVFDPTLLVDGTYVCTVSVTITGSPTNLPVTRTATVTVIRAIGETRNIGSWVSALAEFDAVVGMSYDYIAGQKYLTIGLGMGADGAGDLSGDGRGFVNVGNLNYQADNGYSRGPALFAPYTIAPEWSEFLQTYGSWFSQNYSGPFDTGLERTYSINIPATGYYTWEFAVDNIGYFDIDGSRIGDLTQGLPSNYTTSQQGTLYLTAGTHSLTIYALNEGGPGAIAVQFKDQTTLQEIWSTLTPVRSGNSSPYIYWSEAYRIPLTEISGPKTFYCYNHIVKNVGNADGSAWGEWFGSGGLETRSIFTVQDDGFGNLNVSINPLRLHQGDYGTSVTLNNLRYSLFYHSTIGNRYTQLESPFNESQTRMFTGFDKFGNVTTIVVDPYPGYQKKVPIVVGPVIPVGPQGDPGE
jgi:hypothetical protein